MKDFGKKHWFAPQPVLIVGSYNEDGTPNAMNVAWGITSDYYVVELNLSKHKSTENIKQRKAFTVAFANKENMEKADYVGIVSGNKVPDKIKKAGLNVEKGSTVDAPVFTDFPVTLECKLKEFIDNPDGIVVRGTIENVKVREDMLDKDGNPDVLKMNLIAFESFTNKYLLVNGKAGDAFREGQKIK